MNKETRAKVRDRHTQLRWRDAVEAHQASCPQGQERPRQSSYQGLSGEGDQARLPQLAVVCEKKDGLIA